MNNSDGNTQVISNFECNIQNAVENFSKKRGNLGSENKKQQTKGAKRKSNAKNDRTNKKMKISNKQIDNKKTEVQRNKEIEAQRPICSFYMQGNCAKEEKCQFSHAVSAPIKMELCKFYLLDCCTKGNQCLYMHSQFPCKFYHKGLECRAGDRCKFAHGKPLSEALKQLLFKHIETPPEKILEEFPELTLDVVLNKINSTQKPFGFYNVVESN